MDARGRERVLQTEPFSYPLGFGVLDHPKLQLKISVEEGEGPGPFLVSSISIRYL